MKISTTAEDFHLALLLGELKKQVEQSGEGDVNVLLKINTIIVSASLCEAIINRFISYQVSSNTKFSELERKSLSEKWQKVPKKFDASYDLSASKLEDLNLLIAWRKNIVHPKPKLTQDGIKVLSGNQPEEPLTKDLVLNFINLPILLATELMIIPGTEGFFKGDFFYYKQAVNGSY